MTSVRQWTVLAAVMLLATACGFKLQSRAELPPDMQRVKLEIQDPYSEFARRIETLLEQNGVREYLIRHTVKFRLLDQEGRERIPLQNFEQSRVYSFNNDILAAEREDEFLRNELADSLARMVVRRLGTYGK